MSVDRSIRVAGFQVNNYQAVKDAEVSIPADVTFVVIGGENGAGKTSLVGGLAAALCGAKETAKVPIRKGQKSARVTVKLSGDGQKDSEPLTVERVWTKRDDGTVKSTLEIRTESGYKAPAPQTLLTPLVGRAFQDPFSFIHQAEEEQVKTLKGIIGLDFDALDAEKKQVYDTRTSINVEGKKLKARFEAMPFHEDAPEEEVSIAKLMAEMTRIEGVNKKNDEVRAKARTSEQSIKMSEDGVVNIQSRITELERTLVAEREKLATAQEELSRRKVSASGYIKAAELLVDEDLKPIRDQVSSAGVINERVRENRERRKLEVQLNDMRLEASKLTGRLDEIAAEKEQLVTAAKWPVPGLGYDEHGITLNGLPLSQAATSEQLRTAVAICLAQNPILRVLLVRDGSLLDENGHKLLEDLAREYDCLLLVEYTTRTAEDREHCTIFIEDGEIVESKVGAA